MSGKFRLEFRKDHVHVQLELGFHVTLDHMTDIWTELGWFCREHKCWLVLCEGASPTRSMDVLDVYESGIRLAGVGHGLRMACYWSDYKKDELTRHFENVSGNRGAHVRFFPSRDQALEWLDIGAIVDAHTT